MSFGKVAYCCLLVNFAVLASGMPQDQATKRQETDGPLPFLQFTNGGIRVNFAGYHAEAGLGGLLRGSRTGGGLHASAGTPWGAHAGAGLGGQLDGEGTLGGGLYARAGLGRGRPEAAAGIGGKLDGSGRSANPISGGMYAGATPGGQGVGVYLGSGVGSQGLEMNVVGPFADATDPASGAKEVNGDASTAAGHDAAASATKPSKGHTNIQIIPSRSKDARRRKETVALAAAALPADTPADEKTKSRDKETRRAAAYAAAPPAPPPTAEAGLVGSVYLGVAPIVKSVDKNVVVAAAPAAVAPAAPAAVASAPVAVQANANSSNSATTVAKGPNTVVLRPAHPRWYLRKRFGTVPRKILYATAPAAPVDSGSAPSDVVGELFANTAGNRGGVVAVEKAYTGGSLFDDIFNIPISTLSAVNQLLNNVG